jgi:acetyl-CoA carboxylase biotin carboxyl carrier protein
MELKYIKELMAAMGRTGTTKLSLKEKGIELTLERTSQALMRSSDVNFDILDEQRSAMRLDQGFHRVAELPSKHSTPTESPKPEIGLFITSPMVGTFYPSPAPGEPLFIKVGDRVEKNTVVGIIEAMKVMNEIKSGISGVVAEVYFSEGDPVEFGAKLFRVTPA